MYRNIFISLIFLSSFSFASNGFASEFSHFAGGLIMTALVAFIVFKYFPNYKAKSILIGLALSLLYVTIDQTIDYIKDGKFWNQALDFAIHLFGSIVAFVILKRLKI